MDHFDKLQELVKIAKECSETGELAKSKHAYLDAASISLELSKERNKIEKLSFENIAKELINQARSIQEEINYTKGGPLPIAASHDPFSKTATVKPVQAQAETKSKETLRTKPRMKQLIIIVEGGLPMLSEQFNAIESQTKDQINEILFSGAITAVNQLMMEVLDKPIRTITFDDGVLVIHKHSRLYFALFVDHYESFLAKELETFCVKFLDKFDTELKNNLATGRVLNDNKIVMNYVRTYFGKYL